jgi:hypothetical protein
VTDSSDSSRLGDAGAWLQRVGVRVTADATACARCDLSRCCTSHACRVAAAAQLCTPPAMQQATRITQMQPSRTPPHLGRSSSRGCVAADCSCLPATAVFKAVPSSNNNTEAALCMAVDAVRATVDV